MLNRLIGTLVLSLLGGSQAPVSQTASPKTVACSREASQRYVESFQKIGTPQQRDGINGAILVISFVNDSTRYYLFFAECLARWNSGGGEEF
ncbi:MAG: hypothetical protein ACJ72H_00515 [Candidatus Sulfotelmatobacter sp.]